MTLTNAQRLKPGTGICNGINSTPCKVGCTIWQPKQMDDGTELCSECRHGASAHTGKSTPSILNATISTGQTIPKVNEQPPAADASHMTVAERRTTALIDSIIGRNPALTRKEPDFLSAEREANKGLTSRSTATSATVSVLARLVMYHCY
jgi:hypothetical protein